MKGLLTAAGTQSDNKQASQAGVMLAFTNTGSGGRGKRRETVEEEEEDGKKGRRTALDLWDRGLGNALIYHPFCLPGEL